MVLKAVQLPYYLVLFKLKKDREYSDEEIRTSILPSAF